MTKDPRATVVRDSEAPLAAGTIIDQYRIIRSVGRGGMGEVYAARDTQLGRRVALKLMRLRKDGMPRMTLRSMMEARTTARFSHPNIVTIFGIGKYAGRLYMALEHLEGQDLRVRMRSETIRIPEAIRIAESIARAMAEAHRHDVLHLDLKPSNVFITLEGQVKVLDFGLSQPVEAEFPGRDPSGEFIMNDAAVDRIRGTPRYMAPEQWLERSRSPATDVWAFGVILFEMLAGALPYTAFESDLKVLGRAVSSPDPAPRWMPPNGRPELSALADLVARCLEKKPRDRPTAEDILAALQALTLSSPHRPASAQSPFCGLMPFSDQDADHFYGRDQEIQEIFERLRREPILSVVGASGVGKSSLVQAGLIPRMKADGAWLVLALRPGRAPFETLANRIDRYDGSSGSAPDDDEDTSYGQSLAQELFDSPGFLSVVLERLAQEEDRQVLLLIDQLEELYTLVDDLEIQRRFTQAIMRAADDPQGPVRVVLTVRDDFLSRIVRVEPSARAQLRRMMLLQVPDRQALVETLVKPVAAFGYTYDDERLVEDMVSEVSLQPAGLPLLQFTAQMLWFRRDEEKKMLTRSAYEALGGVGGALARHGDRVLDGMSGADLIIARQLLLRLVTSEETRRVISRAKALEGLGPEAEGVLSRLIESRLLSTVRIQEEGGTVSGLELVHESLIHSWSRLSIWIDQSRDDLRFIVEAEQAAQLWEKRGRRPAELLRGAALKEATEAAGNSSTPIPPIVEELLTASRQRHRQRIVFFAGQAGLVGLLALVAVVGWFYGGALGIVCNDVDQELAGVWDSSVAASVKKAFEVTGLSYASDTFRRTKVGLDAYAETWVQMQTEVCRAETFEQGQTRFLQERKVCLQRRRAQLEAMVNVLMHTDATGAVSQAVQAVSNLPFLSDCQNDVYLSRRGRPSDDPKVRERVRMSRPVVDQLQALYEAGDFDEGLELGPSVLESLEGLEYPLLMFEAHYWIAMLHDLAGHHNDAEKSFRRAVTYASTSQDLRGLVRAWTGVLTMMGARKQKFDEARPLMRWLMTISQTISDEIVQAMVLKSSAQVHYRMGEWTVATKYFQKALVLLERRLGPEHPQVADVLLNQALAFAQLNALDESMAAAQRSVDIRVESLGPEHPLVARSLNHVATLHTLAGQYAEGIRVVERAIEIRERAFGSDHLEVALSLETYALLLYKEGAYAPAIEKYERAIRIRSKALGAEHAEVARLWSNLAAAQVGLGRYEEAMSAYLKAVGIQEKTLGPMHPLVGMVLDSMAELYVHLRQYEPAIQQYERVMDIFRKHYEEDHPLFAYPLTGLGLTQTRRGQLAAAEPLLARALELRRAKEAPQSPSIADTQLAFGELRMRQKRFSEAVDAFQEALLVVKKADQRAKIELWLGKALWQSQRDRDRALVLVRKADQFYRSREIAGEAAELAQEARQLLTVWRP